MERLALRLHPHRVPLLTAGLASFLCAALPAAAVSLGRLAPATWQAWLVAALAPAVLWCTGLALLPSLFHPRMGLVADLARCTRRAWLRRALRGYAALTIWGFAVSPAFVLAAAIHTAA